MATYTGQPTLNLVASFSGSQTSTGSTDVYTVPAGMWAEVQLGNSSWSGLSSGQATSTASANIGNLSLFSVDGTGATSGSVGLSITDAIYPLTLVEGQTCSIFVNDFSGSEVSNLSVIVKQYNNP